MEILLTKFIDILLKPINIVLIVLIYFIWVFNQANEKSVNSLNLVCSSYHDMLATIRAETSDETFLRYKKDQEHLNKRMDRSAAQIALVKQQEAIIKECYKVYGYVDEMPTPQEFRVIPSPLNELNLK
jgi:hypothetical protein